MKEVKVKLTFVMFFSVKLRTVNEFTLTRSPPPIKTFFGLGSVSPFFVTFRYCNHCCSFGYLDHYLMLNKSV
jgi:hypothetical protein